MSSLAARPAGAPRPPGRWALPPALPEEWLGHRASPLLVAGAAVAVAVPELIVLSGDAPDRGVLALAYALGGLFVLLSGYLLAIQASIAQDRALAWAAGGFGILLLVDLVRAVSAADEQLSAALSLSRLAVLPATVMLLRLSRWGMPLLVAPLLVVTGVTVLVLVIPLGREAAAVMAVAAVGAGTWWLARLPAQHGQPWVWPGVATLLVAVPAVARSLGAGPVTAALIEDVALLGPLAGLCLLSARGYFRQARQWQRLEEEVKTLRVSALMPGLSVTPADVAGLPAENEMTELLTEIKPQVALQPFVHLGTGAVLGQEALSRFGGRVPTERWFRAAALHGLGAELERITLRVALASLPRLPQEQSLAVNVSPASLYDREVMHLLLSSDLSRLVVEVTEHDAITDYGDTRRCLGTLRERGARIAVDDVGAGHASLKHLLLLQPDIIKLDTSLTRDVHNNPKQQAMVRSLVDFADQVGATVLAEGVEVPEQIPSLLAAGVTLGQGWHLGLPVISPDVAGSDAASCEVTSSDAASSDADRSDADRD